MIKYFCDRCGKEAKGPGEVWPILRTSKPTREYLLCPGCEKEVREFMEHPAKPEESQKRPPGYFANVGGLYVKYNAPSDTVYLSSFEHALIRCLLAYGYCFSHAMTDCDGKRHVNFHTEKG